MKTPGMNIIFGALVLSLGSVLPATGQTPAITSQVLPTLDMGIAIATSITDNGIVGGVAGSNGKLHAVRWQNGEITDLGNVCDSCIGVIVYDINSSGNVAGSGVTADYVFRPVASIGNSVVELPLPEGYVSGNAFDINDNGQIVGYGLQSSTDFRTLRGLRWASATSAPEVLPLYGAFGLTETGDIAGAVGVPITYEVNGETHALCTSIRSAVMRDGAVEELFRPETDDDDEACRLSTMAYALNARGTAVGAMTPPWGGNNRVAVWDNSSRTLLEPLAGFKHSYAAQHPLNEFGDVAGYSNAPLVPSGCYSVATAWLPEGQFVLPSPASNGACDESNAWAINKHAQIAGSYMTADGTLQLPVVWSIDVDRQDPEVTVATTTPAIAPPNRKMVPVTFTGTIVEQNLASASYAVTDEYGLLQPAGSINVSPSGAYSFTVMLEARRDGGDKDRVYTVTVTAADAGGRTGSAATTTAVKAGRK
jgi:hypothetical protein